MRVSARSSCTRGSRCRSEHRPVLGHRPMHELALARRLVAEALQRMQAAGGARQLTADSVRQHFELAACGTRAEGAEFHVTLAPAGYGCFDCRYEFVSRTPG